MTCTVVRVLALVMVHFLCLQLTASGQVPLVPTGSTWKYLDTGEDPGSFWRTLGFNDGSWSSGAAQLGFGDGDEVTPVSQTNSLGEANITFYFRHTFTVSSPSSVTNLLIRLQRDDGAIIYINDVEVLRSNLRLGEVTPTTLAATANDDGEVLFDAPISPGVLVDGPNVIAVEVHQSAVTSSDLSFDLELLANVPPSVIPLIHRGAVWKYLDDGSEQGLAWVAPEFDDTGWSNGLAQLGFGEGDEPTRVRQMSTITGANAIAYYFRHAFTVGNPSGITNLVARLVRDDGAVLYLNGTEIYRINMPTGAVDSTTFASQVIGNDNAYHAMRVDPALLRPGVNVLAVEMHQFNLTSSDISFDLELRRDVPSTPPTVAISNPANNAAFFGPTNLVVDVLASDYDGPITSIAFYLSGAFQGVDTTDAYDVTGRNYSLVFSNLAAGYYTLTAVATDWGGLSSTSAPVNVSINPAPMLTRLIPTNSVWRYLDTGVDQGTAWQAPNFDDRNWSVGQAKFGTNDLGTNTIIRIRNAANLVIPTCYFRHSFVATNVSSFTNLAFRVLRDDGCIAYLNGVEIFRMNIQSGAVTFNTYVPTIQAVGSADEFTFFPTNISPGLLVNGTNVLAVELHQTQNTTDASFDLELSGVTPRPAGVPPLTIERLGAGLRITWPGTGLILQEADTPGGPFNNLGASSPFPVTTPTGSRFYRLFRP